MAKVYTAIAAVGLLVAGVAAWRLQQDPAAQSHTTQSPQAATSKTAATGPVPVEAGQAEAVRLEDDARAVGSLVARQGVVLRPEVSGRIRQLAFRDGAPVRKGQLLVQLDDTLEAAQLRQAEAQAGIARTNLQRSRELVAQNFISQAAVDQNVAALEVAEAQVALARAQSQRMRIVAPFDGVAGIGLVDVGDYVKDGTDLVNIDDISSLWLDFSLPERYVARLKPQQPVEVTLDAIPSARYSAHVDAIDTQVDANGRSLRVRASLGNPSGTLKPGMFARARIVFAVRDGAVLVPEEALVPQGGKQWLVKLVEQNGAWTGQKLQAQIGSRTPGKVEILSGLVAGDRVVTAGQSKLMSRDGQAVRIVEVGGAAKASPASGASATTGVAPGTAAVSLRRASAGV